ncbi:hypothetical protein ACIPQH_25160 [Streptomyces rubiginosohelvolus]|uniref:hypothetical protein n=1 Tax=Streptomyces rubiginosohelvolus TaxID=67362 RepID=UPI0038246472
MSSEDHRASFSFPEGDPLVSVGREIARQWGANLGGPESLRIAVEAVEPQLKREHQIHLRRLEMQREASARADENSRAAAEREMQMMREKRQHTLWITGLYLGAVISIAMLFASIYVAMQGVWWLAIMLCGPSLVAMGKLYVLRRSDTDDMRAVSQSARAATNAADQAQPPPTV